MHDHHTSALTHEDLRQFTGDLERYRHPFHPRLIYTPGVQYIAERAGAYWLIDAIASYVGSPAMEKAIASDLRLAELQFWSLDVTGDKTATLTCRADSDIEPAIRQDIGFTDFPLDHIDLWLGFDSRYWTLYLPSEH